MKKVEEEPYKKSLLNTPMINYNVYKMSKTENLIVMLVLFVIGGLVGQLFYGGLFKTEDGYNTSATTISNCTVFIIMGILVVILFVPMYRKSQIEKRKNKIKLQFREMLESLSASFSSGSSVQGAFEGALKDLKMQYKETDYIVKEIQEVIDAIYQNLSIDVMLKDFGERSGNEDIMSFADVFEICYKKGGDMKSIIKRTHEVISEKISVSDEIDTKLTSNKMQLNMMSLMPIAIVALLRLTNEAFAANFATPIGIMANTVAIVIFVVAYKYGQKIIDIKG